MSFLTSIASYTDNYWDFRDAKNDGIHSIASYPAPMVASMQREFVKTYHRRKSFLHYDA